jgi:hypothetical protein
VLVLAGCLAAPPWLCAQAPASGNGAGSGQDKPAVEGQKPPAAKPQAGSNPFPEDTSTIPLLPSKGAPDLPASTYNGEESARVPLPGEDSDPARSPDDPTRAAANGNEQDSSSSLNGLDKLLPGPDTEEPGKKKRKGAEIEPTHQETATEDVNVGKYYLDGKNWKAARSRFQSAMVLDPENPEVYWGLAESERHLGDFAAARGHYEKLLEFDPDGPHGKQARKALKDPEIGNAQSSSAGQLQVGSPK